MGKETAIGSDLLEQVTGLLKAGTLVESLKRAAKEIAGARKEAHGRSEALAWDLFAAARTIALGYENPELVLEDASNYATALLETRRGVLGRPELRDENAPAAAAATPTTPAPGNQAAFFIESAQQLEAKFRLSGFTARDLLERAMYFRALADKELGITPPDPSLLAAPDPRPRAMPEETPHTNGVATNGAVNGAPANDATAAQ